MKAVSNATPLIYLAKGNLLNVLKELFGEVYIPQEVYNETVVKGSKYPDSKIIKSATWIQVKPVTLDLGLTLAQKTKEKISLGRIHPGEIEAISLAIELNADRLIVDEGAAVKTALVISKHFSFKPIGTGNVIDMALEQGIISDEDHKNFLKNKSVARISKDAVS